MTIRVKTGENCIIDGATTRLPLINGAVELTPCDSWEPAGDGQSVVVGEVQGDPIFFIEICFRCCKLPITL